MNDHDNVSSVPRRFGRIAVVLLTLLLLSTGAVGAYYWIESSEKRAVARLTEGGAVVDYVTKESGKVYCTVNGLFSARDINCLTNVYELDAIGSPITDEHFRDLKPLPELFEVCLLNANIGDSTLEVLSTMPRLIEVDVSYTKVTDHGMVAVARMPRVRELNLAGTDVGDTGIHSLAASRTLERIRLDHCPLTDKALLSLAGMEWLRYMHLANTAITDEGLRAYCDRRPNIELLNFMDTGIGDEGVANMSKCPRLKQIFLDGTLVTEKGVRSIATCESLKSITADMKQIGDELAQELKIQGITVLRHNGEEYESNFLPREGAR